MAQALGLRQTDVIERHINLALKTQGAVPIGFTVADEPELRHGGPSRPQAARFFANRRWYTAGDTNSRVSSS